VLLLKREYFNQWYRLNPYYFAMLLAKLPMQLAMAVLYITMVYLFTGQPLDPQRIGMFFAISVLVSLASESLGLLIASRLSVVVS
jgi:ABC-2 type transporter